MPWAVGIRIRIPLILLFAGVTFVVADHWIGTTARRDGAIRLALVHGNGDADQTGVYLYSLPASARREYLHEHTDEIRGAFAGVVDANHRFVLVYPESLLGLDPRAVLGIGKRTHVKAVLDNREVVSQFLDDGSVLSSATIEGHPGWSLVEARDIQRSLRAAEREAWSQTIPVALVGLMLTLMVAWFLWHWLHVPAQRLADAADRIAAGDLGSRSGLTGVDELGRAGQAFDRMAERIATTEHELRETKGMLTRIFEAMPLGVLLVRRDDLTAMVVNSKWRELFIADLKPGDHLPSFITPQHVEDDQGRPYDVSRLATPQVLLTGKPVMVDDVVFVATDGTRIPQILYGAPVQLSPGREFDAVLVVVQDRRELVGLMDELRASEDRYAKVAKATGQVVFDWDLVKGSVRYSDGYQAVLGYDRSEEKGPDMERWKERIHPEDRARAVTALLTSLRDGSPFEQEYRMHRQDGRWITLYDRGFFEIDANGRPTRMYGTMADVTERHELEAQLRQAQKMETVGTLAGGVAHDFNNQLTGVLGHLDLLAADLGAHDPRMEHVRIARQAAERCATLTRGLLAFSRRLASRPQPTDMRALVEETSQLLCRMLPASIRVETEFSEGPLTAMVDGVQMQQVLFNLCVNARDAMPDGGRLRLLTRAVEVRAGERRAPDARAGRFVELTVDDTGSGIAPEVIPHIFEPFFTTKPLGEGTGLGLSMVYGIVSKHLGWVELESTPGQGSRFRVYLPVSALPSTPPTPPLAAAPPGEGQTVLVVDDEAVVRELTVLALRENGYHVLEACDGEQALTQVREQLESIRVIVLDVIMPGLSGIEVLKRVRVMAPGIHILLTSGFAPDDSGPAAGEDAFLAKPYATAELLRTVRRLIGQPSA